MGLKETNNKIKQTILKYKLVKEQSRYINKMIKELNDYISYSKDNDIDFIDNINEKMEMIKEFSKSIEGEL